MKADAVDFRLNTFLKTGNPIDAWHCYKNARESGRDIPEEILQYFDGAAEAIVSIANDPPEAKQRPLAVAVGLGLAKKGRGAGSAFNDHSKRVRYWQIAVETFRQLKAWGDGGNDYVFEAVAGKFGNVKKSTVRTIYNEHMSQWTDKTKALIKNGLIQYKPDGKVSISLAPELSSVGDGIFIKEVDVLIEIAKELRKNDDNHF